MRSNNIVHKQMVAETAFAGIRDRHWGPKTPFGRKLAGKWWCGYLLRTKRLESITTLQRQLTGITTRIRKRQTWLNFVHEGRCPQSRTLDNAEIRVPGSRNQFLCPFWQVLESSEPMKAWKSAVHPRLRPHLRGIWDHIVSKGFIGALESRRWMREAVRCDFIDAICLLSGLYLLQIERGEPARAQAVAEATIRAMLIEHSKYPITPFVADLFDPCKAAMWSHLEQDFFRGYDFRVACSTTFAIQALRKDVDSDPGHACDCILLPGPIWTELPVMAPDTEQYFSIMYVSPDNQEKPRWEGSTPVQFGWNLFRNVGPIHPAEMWRHPRHWKSRFDSVTVDFLGRHPDDEHWFESPRSRWPRRFFLKPRTTVVKDLRQWIVEDPEQWAARMSFTPFPKKARLFHVGKEFEPI